MIVEQFEKNPLEIDKKRSLAQFSNSAITVISFETVHDRSAERIVSLPVIRDFLSRSVVWWNLANVSIQRSALPNFPRANFLYSLSIPFLLLLLLPLLSFIREKFIRGARFISAGKIYRAILIEISSRFVKISITELNSEWVCLFSMLVEEDCKSFIFSNLYVAYIRGNSVVSFRRWRNVNTNEAWIDRWRDL